MADSNITLADLEELLKNVDKVADNPKIKALAADLNLVREAARKLGKGILLTAEEMKALGPAMERLGEGVEVALSPLQKFDRALKNNIKALTGVTDASDTVIGSLFKLKSEGKSNTEIF